MSGEQEVFGELGRDALERIKRSFLSFGNEALGEIAPEQRDSVQANMEGAMNVDSTCSGSSWQPCLTGL